MANYVKWEQSGINSNVKPPINRGKGYVAKSATPYKQLLELDLPADFSGKEALLATQKGMEACYSGADQLPGILSDIGHGMTLKDSASYAKLAKMFDATNRDFTRANVAASLFQYSGKKPSNAEVDQLMASVLSGSNDNPSANGIGNVGSTVIGLFDSLFSTTAYAAGIDGNVGAVKTSLWDSLVGAARQFGYWSRSLCT